MVITGVDAGSRCILQSAGFSREGFEETINTNASAGCYKTLCKGAEDDRQLYIEFEGPGIQVPCPSGAYVDLSQIEGAAPSLLLSLSHS